MKLIDWLKSALFASRYRTVAMTLRPGARMEAGDLAVRPTCDGRIIVQAGGEFAVVITPAAGGAVHLKCHSSGGRMPVLIDAEGGRPLLTLGPGGDYVDLRYTDVIGGDPRQPGAEGETA